MPLGSNLKTQFELMKNRFPEVSTAIPCCVMAIVVATIGVGGGLPPAKVEITYC
jgi:hypothetical protein